MKLFPISLSLVAAFTATTSLAVPIYAISEFEMSHSFVINNGNSPEGITINNLASTLVIESEANSAVDDPAATQTTTNNFVVGNPFSDPVVPVQSQRDVVTTLPGLTEGALARYEYSIRAEDDPDPAEFDLTRRSFEQSGAAVARIETDPIAASGFSSHLGGRDFRFDNTTDQHISFNISGMFDAALSASYTGEDGFARASGGFEMLFDVGAGSNVNYFPIAPYNRSIEDSAPGASISEQLLLNSGGIMGINFGASATAIGDGGETVASFEGDSRYIFGISLDAGASLLMHTRFRQANAVEYTPQPVVPPVPLPASLPLFIAGILTFAGLRGKKQVA